MKAKVTTPTSPDHRGNPFFDAFASGVAAVVGKACWERLQYDVLRRTNQEQIGEAVVLNRSGVNRGMNTGRMEFHRLIYVLAAFDKDFSSLPEQFPPRAVLKLGGTRFLAYRRRRISAKTGERTRFEDITEQFPIRNFFIANEVARNMTTWAPLLSEIQCSREPALQGKPLSKKLLAAIAECEESAGIAMSAYADGLRLAFGMRYEDVELRKVRKPLSVTDMPEMLDWAICIRDATTELESWLKDPIHRDHLVWQDAP